MTDSDLELGDSTNPKAESESCLDGSSSENRVDSESIHLTGPSDSSTVVQGVESAVPEGSLDSVSADGNVSDVNNSIARDSNELDVSETHDKNVSSDRKQGSVKRMKNEQKKGQRRKETKSKESTSPAYDSMLSMFDDFAANGTTEARSPTEEGSESPGHGYEVGDMVWGKVKSHPWWPGHVFSEEFATTSVRRSKREGLLLVAFFGDSSYGWFDPSELMPFEPNFAEKSRQTTSKTFVKAVEEAVDEVSRRSALGLSCRCRSKQNFRKTDVEGYYAVDITDYEPGAVYSIDAIEKARASFEPNSALDFIRQLAVEPSREHSGVDFIKNKAKVVSYRRAVFEEFDDTYAEAFGHLPDRPSSKEVPPARAPAKAPLSGRQVFADTSGKGKNPAPKQNKSKDNPKKDKYVLKRREEPKEVKPPPKEIKKEKEKPPSSPQISHIEDSTTISPNDYVLQKRPPSTPEQIPKPTLPESDDPPDFPATKTESDVTGDTPGDNETKIEDKKVNIQTSEPENTPKKVKVPKRPAGELTSGKSTSPEKKKKRKKEPSTSEFEPSLSRVLTDLHLLALDPFTALKKGLAVKTRHVFLKFRSLVFQKSLNPSPPQETDTKPTPVKPERPEDPTKSGRKRAPSDRQEDISIKKKKKIGDIKNLTKEKVTKKMEDSPPAREMKRAVPDRGPPTVLILKFQNGASLPSIHELKAKFVRCGTMDKDKTRVLWRSLQCRVVFKYKVEAKAAYDLAVGSGSLFGNFGVSCSLRPLSDFERPVVPKEEVPLKSCLKKPGGGEESTSSSKGVARVKFVLDGDESHKNKINGSHAVSSSFSSSSPSSSMDLNSKNFQKTSSSSSSSSPILPLPPFSIPNSSSGVANVQFTRPPPLIPLAPPLIPLAPPLLPPPRGFNYGGEMGPLPPPPPMLPPPPTVVGGGKYVHNLERPNIGTTKVDISQQMLRLLTKCNDVVLNVKNQLGYVPYHPL